MTIRDLEAEKQKNQNLTEKVTELEQEMEKLEEEKSVAEEPAESLNERGGQADKAIDTSLIDTLKNIVKGHYQLLGKTYGNQNWGSLDLSISMALERVEKVCIEATVVEEGLKEWLNAIKSCDAPKVQNCTAMHLAVHIWALSLCQPEQLSVDHLHSFVALMAEGNEDSTVFGFVELSLENLSKSVAEDAKTLSYQQTLFALRGFELLFRMESSGSKYESNKKVYDELVNKLHESSDEKVAALLRGLRAWLDGVNGSSPSIAEVAYYELADLATCLHVDDSLVIFQEGTSIYMVDKEKAIERLPRDRLTCSMNSDDLETMKWVIKVEDYLRDGKVFQADLDVNVVNMDKLSEVFPDIELEDEDEDEDE